MLATTVDVTSIDTDEATRTLSEWLDQAGTVAIIAVVAVFVLTVVIGVAIAKKAGYSGWWGAFATLVPVIGWLLLLLFALLKWPALRERDEALTVLRERGIPLPSHERAALKEEERMREREAQARRDMERAQAQRAKAEADRESLRSRADEEATASRESAVASAPGPESDPGSTTGAGAAGDPAPASGEHTTEGPRASGPADETTSGDTPRDRV